jgi:hypothetical protein
MSDDQDLNALGNHPAEFTQCVGGSAEFSACMTELADKKRIDLKVPPDKIIPVIFLPGVMGSNLRMSKARQEELKRPDNRAWRPDDLMSTSGKIGISTGNGFGAWFKNATPAQRQLNFDPNETEIEYYHYTELDGRFDPTGKETLAADARHQNVPDSLFPIPPLMGKRPTTLKYAQGDRLNSSGTAAQIARWRGWSEVLFEGAYGNMLKIAEQFLNNIMQNEKVSALWDAAEHDPMTGVSRSSLMHRNITRRVMGDPVAIGAKSGAALTEEELRTIAPCWYPVHAMGYNFVRSNGESAIKIASRIRNIVNNYQSRGFNCSEVIIVTHSMGGLVARALIHPAYGNMLDNADIKILGIYHGAMPTLGAAGAYKRMRFGFQETEGMLAELEASVLAIDGQHATAILANAPAPLEMMPAAAYGQEWLKVVDGTGRVIWSWPRGKENALESIYLKPVAAWWRLINPEWINPGRVKPANGGGLTNVHNRLKDAYKFLESISATFHPQTFASYCASAERRSYGEVIFKITSTTGSETNSSGRVTPWPAADTWIPLSDDKKGTLTVQAGSRILTLKLQPGIASGDETVPSERSAKHILGTLFEHNKNGGKGYEHQDSYSDPFVIASMLYSVVQIAKTADWQRK